ncbi:hypothetical protein BJ684DRAFT_18534 [Piptocephalis cylindrospora]|uniref:Uncharacterized protein n=1 Tax=Piptocephalis cylindrospora TaxID=1907219 RepID=A0A4V1IYM9_9FUNG|nr:hypothetical protein BJ684DRAFT_18534 [Piptocephalis cylindrospora]|eukprot:RKP15119.1 hypothetical protein BJ684DRAFT_18534 [Piptocephalis cylindrospora]
MRLALLTLSILAFLAILSHPAQGRWVPEVSSATAVSTSSTAVYTIPNPPPAPPKRSPRSYLFSLKDSKKDFTAFDRDFKNTIKKVNQALGMDGANSIQTTLKLTNFAMYTVIITRGVYDWIIHDSRISTFDADGHGGLAR